MTTLTRGSFSLNLGLVRLGADLSDEDRQCAWELYTEISTRVGVVGKLDDHDATSFEGELYVESLESMYKFFEQTRLIMRKFPVGRIALNKRDHLGVLVSRVMSDVLRPFLEKWQVDFRHFWEHQSNPRLAPVARQEEYPRLAEFLADWTAVRQLMREVRGTLIQAYELIDVDASRGE